MTYRRNITLDDIKRAKQWLDSMDVPKHKCYIKHPIHTWQFLRNHNVEYAKWTDEELHNHDKKSGYIGKKCGIECYAVITDSHIDKKVGKIVVKALKSGFKNVKVINSFNQINQ